MPTQFILCRCVVKLCCIISLAVVANSITALKGIALPIDTASTARRTNLLVQALPLPRPQDVIPQPEQPLTPPSAPAPRPEILPPPEQLLQPPDSLPSPKPGPTSPGIIPKALE